jgi:hypothetical protein
MSGFGINYTSLVAKGLKGSQSWEPEKKRCQEIEKSKLYLLISKPMNPFSLEERDSLNNLDP